MGEFAYFGGRRVKVGTIDCLYYLRYEDRFKVRAKGAEDWRPGPHDRYRVPFHDEDNVAPGGYERLRSAHLGCDMPMSSDAVGIVQATSSFGLLVNLPCHHGARLPDPPPGGKVFWNGKAPHLSLAFIAERDGAVVPIIECRACRTMWRSTWAETLPHVIDEKLRWRLADWYVAGAVEEEP